MASAFPVEFAKYFKQEDGLVLLDNEHTASEYVEVPLNNVSIVRKNGFWISVVLIIGGSFILVASGVALLAHSSNSTNISKNYTKLEISGTSTSTSTPSGSDSLPKSSQTSTNTTGLDTSNQITKSGTTKAPTITLETSPTTINIPAVQNVTSDTMGNSTTAKESCGSGCKAAASEMKSFMDESYDPCSNFFKYSCGGWISQHTLPKDVISLDVLDQIDVDNVKIIQKILENYNEEEDGDTKEKGEIKSFANVNGDHADEIYPYWPLSEQHSSSESMEVSSEYNSSAQTAGLNERRNSTSSAKKAQDFYVSCLNKGLDDDADENSWLYEFLGNNSDSDWSDCDYLGEPLRKTKQFVAFFNLSASSDDQKDNAPHNFNKQKLIQIGSGGLTLPRHHYLDHQFKETMLSDYLDYLTQIKQVIADIAEDENVDERIIRRNMESVINFEKQIASMSSLLSNKADTAYKEYFLSLEEMYKIFPYMAWEEYFQEEVGLSEEDIKDISFVSSENVIQSLKDLQPVLKNMLSDEVGRETLKNYLQWHFIKSRDQFINKYIPTSMDLQSALGLESPQAETSNDKTLKCVTETKDLFPDVIGRLFVLETLPLEKLKDIRKFFDEILETYINMVKNISWLDEESRDIVAHRFENITLLNGYPLSLMDKEALDESYSSVEISNSTYSTNLINLSVMKIKNALFKKSEDVVIANAFYFGSANRIDLLAGIEQKIYFDSAYPKIINFARLGYTLGHEMTHGFQYYCSELEHHYEDDQMNSFNNYLDRKSCIEKQYDGFRISSEYSVDGKITEDENFADVAGLQVGYQAYLDNHWKSYEILPGFENFTQSQIFFIAAAQAHCRVIAEGEAGEREIELDIITQTHSPHSIRVVGEMTNNKDFAKAFKCPVGTLYNLQEKCEIFG